jgi:hypothetical protein
MVDEKLLSSVYNKANFNGNVDYLVVVIRNRISVRAIVNDRWLSLSRATVVVRVRPSLTGHYGDWKI